VDVTDSRALPRRRLARLLPDDRVTRQLAVQTLVNTLGNGLFMTVSAVYFTRSVGLSAGQVGLGLTVAGGFGVAAAVPMGQLADRWGAKRMLVALYAAEAVGLVGYMVVRSFAAFLVAACVATMMDRSTNAVKGAMLATALPPERRVRGRAYLRAVTNVGIGAGAALAAVALQLNTRPAYLAMIAADAVTFVVSAVLLRGIPVDAPRTARPAGGSRLGALTDPAFLAVTALNSVLAIQFSLLEVAVPLWIVGHTNAPAAMASAVLFANTVLVVLLQVRAARGTATVPSAARVARRAGLLLAAGCVVFGLAHGLPAVPAALVLLAAGVLETLGEVQSSAAGWAMSYELADPRSPGAYQGVFQSGASAAIMIAPALTTNTAVRFGLPGWLILAALFAVSGAALVPVCRWAAARRTPATDRAARFDGSSG
jgi:MFS transporter